MTKSPVVRIVCLALALSLAGGLGGCSKAREAFGLAKSAPDEFAVVTRAPLSMPPDYGLRPPSPGTTRPQEGTVQQEARRILLQSGAGNGRRAAAGGFSRGERALLGRAGAGNADPSIRATVDRESSVLAAENDGFIDSLIFWQKREPAGVVLDPARESRRLRDNAALGEPATKGATPVIKRRKRGFLEGIFN